MSRRIRVLPLVALGLAGLLVLGGCSADPLNIVILNARAPGDKCDFSDSTLYVQRGSLDFRPGGSALAAGYFQDFSWENQMQPTAITVGGSTVDPGGGNDFIGDTLVYEYQYSDPAVTLASETQNIRAVISAGALPDKNYMGTDLIQPNALTALNSTLGPTPQTLLVTFQMFGKTAGGVAKHTNKVTFPLTVYNSAPGNLLICPNGTKLLTTPCYSGRDAPVQCVPTT
jgi:hypothetical protein